MCPNKEDLKYCRNATSGGLTDVIWKPIDATTNFLSCNHLDQQPDYQKNLQGQQINPLRINDGRVFHCLNRRDENPFDAGKKSNKIDQKTWLDNVEEPCSLGSTYRRCLGGRVDQCVHAGSKFQTLN